MHVEKAAADREEARHDAYCEGHRHYAREMMTPRNGRCTVRRRAIRVRRPQAEIADRGGDVQNQEAEEKD